MQIMSGYSHTAIHMAVSEHTGILVEWIPFMPRLKLRRHTERSGIQEWHTPLQSTDGQANIWQIKLAKDY